MAPFKKPPGFKHVDTLISKISYPTTASLPTLFHLLSLCVCFFSASTLSSRADEAATPNMARYNVIWNSPSKDASGVMPIGNGDIGAGVYALENGDLYLLLAKNDAYTYMGDIFKTGRVKIALSPNPFAAGKPFQQVLDVTTGSIQIKADGVEIKVWVDANHPRVHVQIQSPRDLAVSAQPDLWKRFDHCSYNVTSTYSKGVVTAGEPTQDVSLERQGKLIWYYAVGDHSIMPDDQTYYGIPDAKFPDPFRFNTFGNLLSSPDLTLKDGALQGTGRTFDIRIHGLTEQTPDPEKWVSDILQLDAAPIDVGADWKAHLTWWKEFWNRSWIIASDNRVPAADREKLSGETGPDKRRDEPDGAAVVSQSYNVFRFLMACQSRGRVMTKFNGGLFTQQFLLAKDEKPSAPNEALGNKWLTHPDDRRWGRRFTYQNERLLYWPLLDSGDFDLMKPFFAYYKDMLPIRMAITRAWFGHGGAYYRENMEPTGGERDCAKTGHPGKGQPGEPAQYYHDYYFTNGLETTAMMIDYVNYTGDTQFRDQTLVPFARQVLLFYSLHFPRTPDGKLHMDPAQALETWWRAVNPAPDVAGLRFCLDGLLAMKAGSADDQAGWQKFRQEIPDLPTQIIDGKTALAPADTWALKHNSENAELYPVFPFRCVGLAEDSTDLAEWTTKHRVVKDGSRGGCWTQDQIDWALAGDATQAAKGLERRFRTSTDMCRFPVYAGRGNDECPDFDHFGSGSIALQRMLVQEGQGKILLLPAWPAYWDVDFKLHVSQGGIITGTVKDGRLVTWKIDPPALADKVVVMKPQAN